MPLHALSGRTPRLAASAYVAPSADLIGDVVLEEEASVWFGAVIRADNTPIAIGARSNIQDGAVCHSDPGAPLVVGRGVTVGHRAILHGCTIGDDVLIGMGAIVLNGAVIPDGCMVGAGALVTQGKRFAPGSLVMGSPAAAVRTLDEAQIAGIRASAAGYVERAVRFRAELGT